jgi:CheY-like chemotaxis protein
MVPSRRSVVIVMAEDDPDDVLLAREAMASSRVVNDFRVVGDGEELMQYLRHQGDYTPDGAPPPQLILLDLNMPRKDGRDALKEIKSDPLLCRIPVVVLTTSKADEDILGSYEAGAASFIRKPVTFEGMVEVMRTLTRYWFDIVELPS